MQSLRNEKGLALISTLMLLVLGFGVVAMLLRLVTAETKLSRLEQGYTTALETGKAGADVFLFMVQNGLPAPPNPGIGTGTATNQQCTNIKMNNPSTSWSTTAWTAAGCPTLSTAMNPDPTVQPDVTMTMSGFTISIKVIDTVTIEPDPTAPVGTPCKDSGCFFYTVNIRSISAATNDRSDISFVYRYDR